MNPFTALIDWLDENADYAPIGAFVGLGIALILAFTLGGWRKSQKYFPDTPENRANLSVVGARILCIEINKERSDTMTLDEYKAYVEAQRKESLAQALTLLKKGANKWAH